MYFVMNCGFIICERINYVFVFFDLCGDYFSLEVCGGVWKFVGWIMEDMLRMLNLLI